MTDDDDQKMAPVIRLAETLGGIAARLDAIDSRAEQRHKVADCERRRQGEIIDHLDRRLLQPRRGGARPLLDALEADVTRREQEAEKRARPLPRWMRISTWGVGILAAMGGSWMAFRGDIFAAWQWLAGLFGQGHRGE